MRRHLRSRSRSCSGGTNNIGKNHRKGDDHSASSTHPQQTSLPKESSLATGLSYLELLLEQDPVADTRQARPVLGFWCLASTPSLTLHMPFNARVCRRNFGGMYQKGNKPVVRGATPLPGCSSGGARRRERRLLLPRFGCRPRSHRYPC